MSETKFGKKVWLDGRFVNFEDAKIHAMSHVVHYGSSIFEGIRCYKTRKGSAIFRLDDHVKRFYDSAKIYRMAMPCPAEEFSRKICETVKINGLAACYVRPFAFRGLGSLGLNPLNAKIHACICVWEWGAYLGAQSIEQGIDVKLSTWSRMAPNTFPALAKAGGNYLQGQLMKMEAILDGYAEALILDTNGMISEGSGENIFIVRDGVIYTPPLSSSILLGITRDVVMTLARGLGYEVKETSIPREFIYIADEAFFTGTAAEITPIRSVDKIPVGKGKRGAITKKIQERFFAIVKGAAKDQYGWLKYI